MATADDGLVLDDVDPATVRRIHLVGVAGTGMGSFAGMLKAAGHEVTGSDENVYPPMSDMLRAWAIPVFTPYDPANLDLVKPDLVVIGNVIRRVNPEATEVRARRLPQMSFPAALGSLFLRKRHSVVVAGTHGKTTTSALLGHVLADAGRDPSFLVGGVTRNYDANFRLGAGPHFVVEGDEYDTAYFDKGPKFLHYRPRTAILTSVEFDHADIYRDLAHYEAAFERFVRLLPPDGCLAVSAAYPNALRIAQASAARVVTYGLRGRDASRTTTTRDRPHARSGRGALRRPGARPRRSGSRRCPGGGAHNVENALGVVAAARALGLDVRGDRPGPRDVRRREAAPGGARRGGRRARHRRLRPPPDGGAGDDRRHPGPLPRPAALGGVRAPVEHEPPAHAPGRSTPTPSPAPPASPSRCRSPTTWCPRTSGSTPIGWSPTSGPEGVDARAEADVDRLVRAVADGARPGDVVLVMSNGAFGGFIDRLLTALRSPR